RERVHLAAGPPVALRQGVAQPAPPRPLGAPPALGLRARARPGRDPAARRAARPAAARPDRRAARVRGAAPLRLRLPPPPRLRRRARPARPPAGRAGREDPIAERAGALSPLVGPRRQR